MDGTTLAQGCGDGDNSNWNGPEVWDLSKLFKQVVNKDYSEEYSDQFALRIQEHLAKIDRIVEIYGTKAPGAPIIIFEVLEGQEKG